MKIRHQIDWNDLRTMCVRHRYYTFGNSNEYDRMLNAYAGEYIAPTKLKEAVEYLAQDIKNHSYTQDSVIDIANAILQEVVVSIAI